MVLTPVCERTLTVAVDHHGCVHQANSVALLVRFAAVMKITVAQEPQAQLRSNDFRLMYVTYANVNLCIEACQYLPVEVKHPHMGSDSCEVSAMVHGRVRPRCHCTLQRLTGHGAGPQQHCATVFSPPFLQNELRQPSEIL